jgi:aminoglycoside 6'-N-acetyltransferase I
MAGEVEVRMLRPGDERVLLNVADDVFDYAVSAAAVAAFLADPRHHIAAAVDGGRIVGFASGVHYFHPDKPVAELFVNEVGVAATHRGRGLGTAVVKCLLDAGRALGCGEAWVLTDRANAPAMATYTSAGGVAAPQDQVMFTFFLDERADAR